MEKPERPLNRPYFVPAEIEFDTLPLPVQAAFATLVQPSYDELVVSAKTALERSAGVTLVFLLTLEILDQFELGHGLNLSGSPDDAAAAQREKVMQGHLRLITAKQKVANFVMKIRTIRAKRGPHYFGPLDV